jgi:hypothetical protein
VKTQENSDNLLDQLAADNFQNPINPVRGLPVHEIHVFMAAIAAVAASQTRLWARD